jgi:hypothetical protein
MLNFDRSRALDPQHQRRRLGTARIARPLHANRLGVRRDVVPDNIGPMGHDLARRKALAGKGVPQAFVQKFGQRPRVCFAGLAHGLSLCHHRQQYDASRNIGSAKAHDAR